MPSFHVYVEGAVEPTPDAMRRLAEAIAEKYGLQTADLIARMTKGRFRVKANIDGETADKYRRDLVAIGARVAIEEARGNTSPSLPPRSTPGAGVSTPPPIAEPTPRASAPRASAAPPIVETTRARPQQIIERVRASAAPPIVERVRATPIVERVRASAAPPIAERAAPPIAERAAPPIAEPARARASAPPPIEFNDEPAAPPIAEWRAAAPRPSVPPPIGEPAPRPTPPPAAPRTTTPPSSSLTSGLAAAYTGPQETSDLGALALGGSIAVSALDGSGDEEVMENQFSAPAPERPKAAPTKGPRPKDVPVEVDMFAPPDGESAEMKMEIAADEIEHRARKRMSTPPAATPVAAPPSPPASPPLRRSSAPTVRPATTPVAVVRRSKLGPLGEPRVRFALGVLVAILLGFVPAHVSAAMREHSIYSSIDGKVETAQAAVDTPEEYDALDAFRAEQLNQKHTERKMIAFTSLLVWAACAGALGYVWFRRIPWDRLD